MSPRRYESTVRADAAAATTRRILRAAIDLAYERRAIDMTLEQVATRAGTTVKTILRKFGSRDGLIEAAVQLDTADVIAERRAPDGDPEAGIRLLVDHYERRGAFVLSILATDEPWARTITAGGRLAHREWVEQVFAASLPGPGVHRDELVDLLVVATDVYAWKLLRLDRGLDAETTAHRIHTLAERILADPKEP